MLVAANKVRDEADVKLIQDALPDVEMVVIPEDGAVLDADRDGASVLDVAPDSAAVQAVEALARRIAGHRR